MNFLLWHMFPKGSYLCKAGRFAHTATLGRCSMAKICIRAVCIVARCIACFIFRLAIQLGRCYGFYVTLVRQG